MKAKISKRKKFKKRGVENRDVILNESSFGQINYIDSLLETSCLSLGQKEEINERLNDITEGEAEELINYLLENQVDRVSGGFNYQQKDIIKKLKSFI